MSHCDILSGFRNKYRVHTNEGHILSIKLRFRKKRRSLSMEQPSEEKLPEEQPKQKKKYEAPRLIRYGTLAEITGASGIRSKNSDNALHILKTA